MAHIPAAQYRITRYSDGCLWGDVTLDYGDEVLTGSWKYSTSTPAVVVLERLIRWVGAVLTGEYESDELYEIATGEL